MSIKAKKQDTYKNLQAFYLLFKVEQTFGIFISLAINCNIWEHWNDTETEWSFTERYPKCF